jgi:glyoxylase-like metal-dependent hydrolase (beta-lactamase superfamily II)
MVESIGRRLFLVRAGRGVLAMAVLGAAACSSDDEGGGAVDGSDRTPSPDPTDPTSSPPETPSDGPADVPELSWSRVDLGFVSAYVLVRGREAAVVDTGVGGSADDIGDVLDEAGPGWAGVRHVVLTHKHPDHVGSIGDVADRAASATLYAGAEDIDAIDTPRRLRAVGDGDDVLGLQVVATPGHTAGHVAVFDPGTRVLVAGDALNNDGRLTGSNPQFTEDEQAAADSVRKLADLEPEVILVGHGPPVRRGASGHLGPLARAPEGRIAAPLRELD